MFSRREGEKVTTADATINYIRASADQKGLLKKDWQEVRALKAAWLRHRADDVRKSPLGPSAAARAAHADYLVAKAAYIEKWEAQDQPYI